MTDFNGRTLSYEFDAAGQLQSRTNGAGQTTRYVRDLLGRILRTESEGALTTFAYDHAGQLRSAHSAAVRLDIERDLLGRRTRETVNGHTTTYCYDVLGRRTRRVTPSGVTSEWTYGATGLPTRLRHDGRRIGFTHDAAGREELRTVEDRLQLRHTWDANHRLRSLSWSVGEEPGSEAERAILGGRDYLYGPGDRLLGIDDLQTGRTRFDLDPVGRVTAVAARDWTERYVYDSVGNLTSAASPASSGSSEDGHTYMGNRVVGTRRDGFEYDAQGRVVRRTRRTLSGNQRSWHFAWDADDRLTNAVTPNGHHWHYSYDPLGRRIAKERTSKDGLVAERVEFIWDGDRLIEQIQVVDERAHSITWDYAPQTSRPIAQSERRRLRDAPQEEIDQRFHAIVTDLVGTPTQLIGPDGDVPWCRASTLWGIPVGDRPTGEADCPLGFPGQYLDRETGLHYNRHRYYDPDSARYLSPDPLGLDAAPDHYAYVRNPYLWSDPLGLQECPVFKGVQWMTGKMLSRVSFKYQKFVTGQKYEQIWKLEDGREVHLDGGLTADGYIVEAKWTGGERAGEWARSFYNPANPKYDEGKIVTQAQKLLDLNDGLGGSGVRYAISNIEGATHFTDLLKAHFPQHFADGRLNVFHVPGNGMSGWTR